MSIASATERCRLAEDDLEPIRRSHFPLLQRLPLEEAQEHARWLRARRGRAGGLMREHWRSVRGKAARAAVLLLPDADRGLTAKKQTFAGALKRVNARLDALLAAERRDRNIARLRGVLARPLPSRKPRPTIHGARIGSTSQVVRDSQVKRGVRG